MSLQVSNLTKSYGNKVVVDHLNFSMEHPGVYALLGTNGAGKTTSIRMMLNMLARDEGTVLWNDAPLTIDTCNVGYLAEERGLYPKYPLMDQLLYFAQLRGVAQPEAKKRIRYWAERLELEEYLYPREASAKAQGNGESQEDDPLEKQLESHRTSQLLAQGQNAADSLKEAQEQTGSPAGKPADNTRDAGPSAPARQKGLFGGAKKNKPKVADQLSKGNQQKIQLLAALLSEPELPGLDEPLSGLDPVNADLFRGIIREEISKGKYLIMSSHQMETVEEFCTEITIMDRSRAVLQGNLNEIKKSYGRVNLHLKVEQDITEMINSCGIRIKNEKEHEYNLKVRGEEQANTLLYRLIEAKIPVITFDLREPSLHEIFIEKAGEARNVH